MLSGVLGFYYVVELEPWNASGATQLDYTTNCRSQIGLSRIANTPRMLCLSEVPMASRVTKLHQHVNSRTARLWLRASVAFLWTWLNPRSI